MNKTFVLSARCTLACHVLYSNASDPCATPLQCATPVAVVYLEHCLDKLLLPKQRICSWHALQCLAHLCSAATLTTTTCNQYLVSADSTWSAVPNHFQVAKHSQIIDAMVVVWNGTTDF